MTLFRKTLAVAVTMALAQIANAQIQGPSTGSTPYLLPVQPGTQTISVLTVDNTGAINDDTVPLLVNGIPTGGSYAMAGIPDGTGAFDNGDGTFTLLVNHELGNTVGTIRAHGAIGSYVSKWIINKNTLQVVGGEDLIKQVFGWNATLQQSNAAPGTFTFGRFCSADLPEVSAFYNAASGLGSQARIFMHGEEGTTTGWQNATVVTGPDAGKSYILGKFNLSTNGSGLVGVGAWENALASPFPQDKTVVVALNDGGTGIMNNAVNVYVGTKTNSGSEVDKAGLTNGVLKFIQVVAPGNVNIPTEIVNAATRATSITNGMSFVLSPNTRTQFSRPEDGVWNPLNPNQFFFATTDQYDQVSDGIGAQVGQTRLWRLTFTDITNPDLGGTIDLIVDGQVAGGQKVNMIDNIGINKTSGKIMLQEDVGGQAHNGKIWELDMSTFNGTPNSGTLTMVAKHDPARFGDRVGGVTTPATFPFNQDEEASGIIDITDIMGGGTMHKGNPREAWYISTDQTHYNATSVPATGLTPTQVEGGQIFVLHQIAPDNNLQVTRSGFVRNRVTGIYNQQVTIKNNNAGALQGPFYVVLDGLSANATLNNASGNTGVYAPLASPYIQVPGGSLAPGATATVTLQFANPTNAAISYNYRTLNSITTP